MADREHIPAAKKGGVSGQADIRHHYVHDPRREAHHPGGHLRYVGQTEGG